MISACKPKIAAYHFTTLTPNLGVVKLHDFDYVIADLPGLIEGASEGAGLGHKFLKHIERTKIICHVIDMSGSEGRDPYEDYINIRKELEQFSKKLISKTTIDYTKMDFSNIISKEEQTELQKGNLKIGTMKKIYKDLGAKCSYK